MGQGPSGATRAGTAIERGLDQVARERVTGRLHLDIPATAASADVFVVDGALYSVLLDGFEPQIVRRLLASDLLTEEQVVVLADLGGDDAAAIGHHALDRGWVGAHQLSAIHHELLMASLSALLAAEDVRVDVQVGEVTARYCTAPVEWDEVRLLLSHRHAKVQHDCASIESALGGRGGSFSPSSSVLRACGDLAGHPALPGEFATFHECLRAPQTVDQAAGECGYSRAEALHITAEFARAGLVESAKRVGKSPQPASYAVPEAFPVREHRRRFPRHG